MRKIITTTYATLGRRPLVVLVAFAAVAGACGSDDGPAEDAADASSPAAWIQEHAVALDTVDPAAPLDDLAPLRDAIGDAEVVGLGESVHGAAEEIELKHRALRVLVEDLGVRSVAWEEDWTTGRQVDEFLRGGTGDLDALMAQMSPQWQSAEVADVLAWLRDFNAGRPRRDQVEFVGVEYYLTGPAAYDAVDAYVARSAPGRLAELRRHLQVIRPAGPDPFAHIQAYQSVADKAPYLRHARAVVDQVEAVAHEPDDRAHALALHTARQIASFYEHFALPESEALVFRDARRGARTCGGGSGSAATRSPTGRRAPTRPTHPTCASRCRPTRTSPTRPSDRTCAAGTATVTCRSGSPSTTAPSASAPTPRCGCRLRHRAGSRSRSAPSTASSSSWTSAGRRLPRWTGG